MKELSELRNGLMNSSKMLLKDFGSFLECSFIHKGLVNCIVVVEDSMIAEALRRKVKFGIAEGIQFNIFRHEFDSFALHIKARKLYAKLFFNLSMCLPAPKEEDYRPAVNAAVA